MVMPSPARAEGQPNAKNYLLKSVPLINSEIIRKRALEQRHNSG
jgi:hypothetical protein